MLISFTVHAQDYQSSDPTAVQSTCCTQHVLSAQKHGQESTFIEESTLQNILATCFNHPRLLVTHVRLCLGRHALQRRRGSSRDPKKKINTDVPRQSENKIADKFESRQHKRTTKEQRERMWKHREAIRDPARATTKNRAEPRGEWRSFH